MEISDVRIKLVDAGAERLLAFCSITIDAAFVVRDLKLIGGPSGPFVAMPSRKLTGYCGSCGGKTRFAPTTAASAVAGWPPPTRSAKTRAARGSTPTSPTPSTPRAGNGSSSGS